MSALWIEFWAVFSVQRWNWLSSANKPLKPKPYTFYQDRFEIELIIKSPFLLRTGFQNNWNPQTDIKITMVSCTEDIPNIFACEKGKSWGQILRRKDDISVSHANRTFCRLVRKFSWTESSGSFSSVVCLKKYRFLTKFLGARIEQRFQWQVFSFNERVNFVFLQRSRINYSGKK